MADMKQKIAFIFPGQGAQYPGMGKDFYEEFPQARKIFQKADEYLQFKISEIAFDGPASTLVETRHSQVAIFVHSVAILEVLKEKFPDLLPKISEGLSLGEYTALYATGRLSFFEALLLVRDRANFMNEACEKTTGTMAAVLGMDISLVEKIISDFDDVWIANLNCPGQIVISGSFQGIEKVSNLLKENGAKRVLPLDVHGAFHSGLMKEAQKKLAPRIEGLTFKESTIPLVMNTIGDYGQKDSIKKHLTEQVTHSVLWAEGVKKMEEDRIDLYLEIGPGRTLANFNKRIGVKGKTISIDKVSDLEALHKYFESITCLI